jgi:hypothetical protein
METEMGKNAVDRADDVTLGDLGRVEQLFFSTSMEDLGQIFLGTSIRDQGS